MCTTGRRMSRTTQPTRERDRSASRDTENEMGRGTHVGNHRQDDGAQDQVHVHIHACYVARYSVKKNEGTRFTSERESSRGIDHEIRGGRRSERDLEVVQG